MITEMNRIHTSRRPVLLVADLDGTYLDEGGKLPPSADEFASTLAAYKVDFVVATSRPPHNVTELLGHLETPFYAICSDGGTTVEIEKKRWKVVSEENLEPNTAARLAEAMSHCKTPNELFLFLTSRTQFAIYHLGNNRQDENLRVLRNSIGENRPVRKLATFNQALNVIGADGIRAISWFAPRESVEAGLSEISSLFKAEDVNYSIYPEVRYQSYSWLDIASHRCSKGAALQRLIKPLETAPWVIALGNGDNDVSLFSIADVSLCPRDASTAAKRTATQILDVSGGDEFIQQVTALLRIDRYLYRGVT